VLRAEAVGTAGKLVEASFRLHAGEILGVAGLTVAWASSTSSSPASA